MRNAIQQADDQLRSATLLERLVIAALTSFLGLAISIAVWFFLSDLAVLRNISWPALIGVCCGVTFIAGLWRPHATAEWLGGAWKQIFSFSRQVWSFLLDRQ
jgi:hypothetical protein